MKTRLIWIEDDVRFAQLLSDELSSRFEFFHYRSLDACFEALSQGEVSLESDGVLIDLHFSQGKKGVECFKQLRALGYKGPIFVLSNDETISAKIEMLEMGVDDYLWKVMPIEELSLRLMNGVRRYQTLAKPSVRSRSSLGGLVLDLENVSAKLKSKPLDLSLIEYKIMSLLLREYPAGVLLTQLKQRAWGQEGVGSGTINTFIWKLNKKLVLWDYRIVRNKEELLLLSKTSVEC